MFPELSLIFGYFWQIIKGWWWLFFPFLLWRPFLYFWSFWRTETWLKKTFKAVLLEIKIPKEVLKPIRAMENVLAGIFAACYEPPNWIEKWWEGQCLLSIHLEIVSIGGGGIHFYIRCPEKYRDAIESNIYSQYPEVEIIVADDYTKHVPPDMPNKEWDFWGTDYRFLRPNPYPILTYKKFETGNEKEEKRIDPMASLLEGLAKMKPGEQFWVQISVGSIAEGYAAPFFEEGKRIRDQLAKRPEKPKPKPILQETAEILITGKPNGTSLPLPEAFPSVRMRLTPGEEEIMKALEEKITKPVFQTNIRFIYLGKREVFFKPNVRLGFGFFANYLTVNLNGLVPFGKTITKVKSRPPFNIFDARRAYLRQRRLLRHYKDRTNSYFPRSGRWPAVFVLNIEELASLYHFPSWQVAPVSEFLRVEAKKGPPPELPIE